MSDANLHEKRTLEPRRVSQVGGIDIHERCEAADDCDAEEFDEDLVLLLLISFLPLLLVLLLLLVEDGERERADAELKLRR